MPWPTRTRVSGARSPPRAMPPAAAAVAADLAWERCQEQAAIAFRAGDPINSPRLWAMALDIADKALRARRSPAGLEPDQSGPGDAPPPRRLPGAEAVPRSPGGLGRQLALDPPHDPRPDRATPAAPTSSMSIARRARLVQRPGAPGPDRDRGARAAPRAAGARPRGVVRDQAAADERSAPPARRRAADRAQAARVVLLLRGVVSFSPSHRSASIRQARA